MVNRVWNLQWRVPISANITLEQFVGMSITFHPELGQAHLRMSTEGIIKLKRAIDIFLIEKNMTRE